MTYRLRPTEIDAWQWTGQPAAEWPAWMPEYARPEAGCVLLLWSRGGRRPPSVAQRNDWLLHDGERVTVMAPDEFERKYEGVTT